MTIRHWLYTTVLMAALLWAARGQPIFVPVSAAISGSLALGAMHHPWICPALGSLVWINLPEACGSAANDLLAGGCLLGWFMGAFVGAILRRRRRSPAHRAERTSPR